MGNLFECLGKNQPRGMSADEPHMSFISTRSITNYSMPSKDDSDSTRAPSVSTNSSYKFSWYRLQSIYLDSLQKSSLSKIKIEPPVLAIMNKIFSAVKNHIGSMSHTFYDCLIEMDKIFPAHFEECATKNPRSFTEGKPLVDRIRSHIISMIYLHTIIINHLQNGENSKVQDIIKLIAISHVLMKVKPALFNQMDMITTKFLLRAGLLCDENAEAVVIYFNFVTTSIINNMNLHATDKSNITYSCIARENYRHMKRWYNFLEEIHNQISELDLDSAHKINVEEVEDDIASHSTIPTDILKQDACLIKYCFKKKINKTSIDN